MTLRTDVYDEMAADSDLTGIVGGRIYYVQMPQSPTYPTVVFEILPTSGRVHLMGSDSALAMDMLRVSVWGEHKDFANMELAAGYIKTLLQDFTGTLGTGVTVERIFLETGQSALFNVGAGVYQIPQDFIIWYQEA